MFTQRSWHLAVLSQHVGVTGLAVPLRSLTRPIKLQEAKIGCRAGYLFKETAQEIDVFQCELHASSLPFERVDVTIRDEVVVVPRSWYDKPSNKLYLRLASLACTGGTWPPLSPCAIALAAYDGLKQRVCDLQNVYREGNRQCPCESRINQHTICYRYEQVQILSAMDKLLRWKSWAFRLLPTTR